MRQFLITKLSSFIYKILTSKYSSELVKKDKDKAKKALLKAFKKIGANIIFPDELIIKNPQYITIGDNFFALKNLRIEAWDMYEGTAYIPSIQIGDNVIFNTDVHIGAINKIVIGNNVMLASRIYISDHSHGKVDETDLKLPPSKRPLFSKGPVIIEDNVWIGEGVAILPNVKIGKNAVIGANSVVTKDVPQNAIIAGVPARIIKILKNT